MMYKILNFRLVSVLFFAAFILMIMVNPQLCRQGVTKGLLLCGRVVIPSLFPFTVCVLFIIKSRIMEKLKFLDFFTQKVFGLSFELFSLMILSFTGGYPVGAKLLSCAVEEKRLTPGHAGIMLNYCVNAGPGFIVAAVGSAIMGSQKLGIILLISHISGSLIICIVSRFFKTEKVYSTHQPSALCFTDNFILSVSEAASSLLSICSFVILFSSVNSYIEYFSNSFKFFHLISLFTEVTNAVTLTNNIYLIAFLLGFAGLSIWCQILAVGNKIKINFLIFVLFRILHGFLSAVFTYLIIRFCGITVPAVSNGKAFNFTLLYSTPALAISMLIMGMVFVISVTTKKYAGKITENMI